MHKYKEAAFPLMYRAAQVSQVMDAIGRVSSIAVFGLAGMGKSNLFRFLVGHPQVRDYYLGEAAPRFDFLFVDCNLVDPRSQDAFLEELDEQLDNAGIPQADISSLRPPSLRRLIQRRLEKIQAGRVLVILFDPLDQAFGLLDPSFWAYLRGLRDLQGNLVFVLGARRPPPALPELDELFTSSCWVTPLVRADALDSIARDEKRLGVTFSAAEQELVLELSGGHPGLLRNAADLVARHCVRPEGETQTIAPQILAHEPIERVCAELWSDLTPEQQTLLKWNALDSQAALPKHVPKQSDSHARSFLERTHLLQSTKEQTCAIYSPIFAEYVRAQTRLVARVIVEGYPHVRLQSWQGETTVSLSETAHQLLSALTEAPAEMQSYARLSRVLYSGDPDYSRQALEAHVKRLRRSLNTILHKVLHDDQFVSIVSVRKQGYRLNLASSNGWEIEYQRKS